MLRWYVINTRPKKESQVERLFEEGGFTVYCPKYVREKRIGPFFPGYAFVRFEFPEQFQMVKYTAASSASSAAASARPPSPRR